MCYRQAEGRPDGHALPLTVRKEQCHRTEHLSADRSVLRARTLEENIHICKSDFPAGGDTVLGIKLRALCMLHQCSSHYPEAINGHQNCSREVFVCLVGWLGGGGCLGCFCFCFSVLGCFVCLREGFSGLERWLRG